MNVPKISKRACDGCKIRKIKCSELPPCNGCIAVGIPCTFKKHPLIRGPRTLRAKTIQEIARTQRQHSAAETPSTTCAIPPAAEESPPTRAPVAASETIVTSSKTPIASLVLRLCIYRLRLFPVWPIIAVEEIMASLQRDEEDLETYALANAVGAATIAQLKLNRSDADVATGSSMEAECQRAKLMIKGGPHVNLNSLRIAFFLHVYHENQDPGGVKSLLYLREAITMAQIMNLHRESSYVALSSSEQQIRRRILWLLFVTERGVAMLHKLPVVLKPNTLFLSVDGDDENHILPAFQKLVNLFWVFDQSGAFDILQNSDTGISSFGEIKATSRSCLDLLQQKLQDIPIDQSSSDVQRADICVTRQFMRAVLWRVSMNHGRLSSTSDQVTSLSHPIQIAKEFLAVISQLPNTAIEAHGPSMEFKIYEIATAVTDALSNNARLSWASADRPRDILNQLQQILASCRGGNKMLVSLLCNKIADIQNQPQMLVEPSSRFEELDDQWLLQSVTSPAAPVYDSNMDFMQNPQEFESSSQQPLANYESGVGEGRTESLEDTDDASPLDFSIMQQRAMPQLMDLSWYPSMMGDLPSSLNSSTDLFEQLQNFDGSFNNLESSGTLETFMSTGNLGWGEG